MPEMCCRRGGGHGWGIQDRHPGRRGRDRGRGRQRHTQWTTKTVRDSWREWGSCCSQPRAPRPPGPQVWVRLGRFPASWVPPTASPAALFLSFLYASLLRFCINKRGTAFFVVSEKKPGSRSSRRLSAGARGRPKWQTSSVGLGGTARALCSFGSLAARPLSTLAAGRSGKGDARLLPPAGRTGPPLCDGMWGCCACPCFAYICLYLTV